MHSPPPMFLYSGHQSIPTPDPTMVHGFFHNEGSKARCKGECRRICASFPCCQGPGASALSDPLHLPFVCSLGRRRGSQVAHFFQCSLVWSKTQNVSNNRNLPLPFPFLSPVLHVFLFSLSLSFRNTQSYFFFRFSSSPGMNCIFVKNAVLIPKAFLVRCPLLCSLSVSPPKLGNLALLKTWKCWSTFEAGAPAALAPFQKAAIRIPAFLFPSPSNSLTLSINLCRREGVVFLSFWRMNEWMRNKTLLDLFCTPLIYEEKQQWTCKKSHSS